MTKSNGIYEFGPFRLDVGARRLYRDSVPVTLTPKCYDLLFVLVVRHGQALSKSELLETVWPDVEVEEGNLTFQMAALRKALGPEAAGWIETVPRFGYLFSVPVTERRAVDSAVESVPNPVKSVNLWRRFAVASVVVAVVVLVGFLLSARVWSTPQILAPRPFTGLPGDETAPSVSRDGKDVAFLWNGPERSNWDVYVKSEGIEDPLRFTFTPEAEFCPKWSPDGRRIAFARRLKADLASIIVKPYPDGPEREIAQVRPCFDLGGSASKILDWHPDGDHLAVAGAEFAPNNCGISFVSANTGRIHPLTGPPQSSMLDIAPAVSPDGRKIAFMRGSMWPAFLVYTLDISADLKPLGSPRPLTSNGITELWPAWLPGSDEVLFSGGDSPSDGSLFRSPAPGPARARRVQGVDSIAFLASVSAGGRLVYATRPALSAFLRRIELLPEPATNPVETDFAPSTYRQQAPVYSPNGKLIAFESERAGVREIWLSAPDGTQLRRLTHFDGPAAQGPQWSPDGTRLACTVAHRGQRDIFLVDVPHGTSTRLTNTPDDEVGPAWSSDGKWIYYASDRSGNYEGWKVLAVGGESIQVTRNGGRWPRESPDGEFIYFIKSSTPPSLWRVHVEGGAEALIVEGVYLPTGIAVVHGGIYYFSSPDQPARSPAPMLTIRFLHLASGRIRDLATVTGSIGWGFTVSPDGHSLIFPRELKGGFDLKVADNLR